MPQLCQRIAGSGSFQGFILVVIALAAVLVGVETYHELVARHHELFSALDTLILAIFTVEVIIRILAFGARPWAFFRQGWNIFDFVTVAIFFTPFVGSEAAILRLARVVRMLRLVKAIPGLQMLIAALLHSLPSIGYIGLLLLMHVYVYGVLGTLLFGEADPEEFGNLGVAMQTLAQVVTFDDWARIMKAQTNQIMASLYFVSFILLGTMIILNLFVGVIMEGFVGARQQFEIERRLLESMEQREDEVEEGLSRITRQLEELTREINQLAARVQRGRAPVS